MKLTTRINNYKNFDQELNIIDSIYNTEKTDITLKKELPPSTKRINDNFKSKYKCFIPVEMSKFNTFHSQFETVTYQDDRVEHFYDCIRFKIDNLQYDLTQLRQHGRGYFIIENFEEVEFKDFCDSCFSVRQALGFISAYMPGGEEYYFSKEQEYFYCNYHRPQIVSIYQPLNGNLYSILPDKKDVAERFKDKLNFITSNVFSNLVSKIHENKQFSSSIILLLEASSTHSFLLIPSVFSVIVEALSKIISRKEVGKELPINDSELFRKIRDELILLIKAVK